MTKTTYIMNVMGRINSLEIPFFICDEYTIVYDPQKGKQAKLHTIEDWIIYTSSRKLLEIIENAPSSNKILVFRAKEWKDAFYVETYEFYDSVDDFFNAYIQREVERLAEKSLFIDQKEWLEEAQKWKEERLQFVEREKQRN